MCVSISCQSRRKQTTQQNMHTKTLNKTCRKNTDKNLGHDDKRLTKTSRKEFGLIYRATGNVFTHPRYITSTVL